MDKTNNISEQERWLSHWNGLNVASFVAFNAVLTRSNKKKRTTKQGVPLYNSLTKPFELGVKQRFVGKFEKDKLLPQECLDQLQCFDQAGHPAKPSLDAQVLGAYTGREVGLLVVDDDGMFGNYSEEFFAIIHKHYPNYTHYYPGNGKEGGHYYFNTQDIDTNAPFIKGKVVAKHLEIYCGGPYFVFLPGPANTLKKTITGFKFNQPLMPLPKEAAEFLRLYVVNNPPDYTDKKGAKHTEQTLIGNASKDAVESDLFVGIEDFKNSAKKYFKSDYDYLTKRAVKPNDSVDIIARESFWNDVIKHPELKPLLRYFRVPDELGPLFWDSDKDPSNRQFYQYFVSGAYMLARDKGISKEDMNFILHTLNSASKEPLDFDTIQTLIDRDIKSEFFHFDKTFIKDRKEYAITPEERLRNDNLVKETEMMLNKNRDPSKPRLKLYAITTKEHVIITLRSVLDHMNSQQRIIIFDLLSWKPIGCTAEKDRDSNLEKLLDYRVSADKIDSLKTQCKLANRHIVPVYVDYQFQECEGLLPPSKKSNGIPIFNTFRYRPFIRIIQKAQKALDDKFIDKKQFGPKLECKPEDDNLEGWAKKCYYTRKFVEHIFGGGIHCKDDFTEMHKYVYQHQAYKAIVGGHVPIIFQHSGVSGTGKNVFYENVIERIWQTSAAYFDEKRADDAFTDVQKFGTNIHKNDEAFVKFTADSFGNEKPTYALAHYLQIDETPSTSQKATNQYEVLKSVAGGRKLMLREFFRAPRMVENNLTPVVTTNRLDTTRIDDFDRRILLSVSSVLSEFLYREETVYNSDGTKTITKAGLFKDLFEQGVIKHDPINYLINTILVQEMPAYCMFLHHHYHKYKDEILIHELPENPLKHLLFTNTSAVSELYRALQDADSFIKFLDSRIRRYGIKYVYEILDTMTCDLFDEEQTDHLPEYVLCLCHRLMLKDTKSSKHHNEDYDLQDITVYASDMTYIEGQLKQRGFEYSRFNRRTPDGSQFCKAVYLRNLSAKCLNYRNQLNLEKTQYDPSKKTKTFLAIPKTTNGGDSQCPVNLKV